MKTRPVRKCYTVFDLIKSCISTTYEVSRPEFDGSYWLAQLCFERRDCYGSNKKRAFFFMNSTRDHHECVWEKNTA